MECVSNYIWEKNERQMNEDALVFVQVAKGKREYLLAAVCDGIGGLAEGENASSFVADSLEREMIEQLKKAKDLSRKGWKNLFLRRIAWCHARLGLYGKEKGIRLGTTISMVFLQDGEGYILHAGDSAIFSGKRRLKRTTVKHRTKNGALKRAVGVGENCKVDCQKIRVRKGSVLLLGSDGFYRKMEGELEKKEGIRELNPYKITEKEIRIWLGRLHNRAKQLGEKDNSTAICMVFR